MGMYLTMEEVRAYHIEALSSMDEKMLESLIRLYSGVVEEYCRTKFLPVDAEFKADAEKRIMLPKRPVLSVAAVKYKDIPLCENEEYFVYEESSQVRLLDYERYEKKRKSIDISYIYGYEKVPSIVKKVILDLIRLDRESLKGDATVTSESFEDYSYQKSGKTTEDMQRDRLKLLDSFVQEEYTAINNDVGNVRARLL